MIRAGLFALAVLLVSAGPAHAVMPKPAKVQVFAAPCPDQSRLNAGCAYADGRVYVWPADPYTLSHEIGHVFASTVMTAGDRAWFSKRLGSRKGKWGHAVSERFADAYAICDLGDVKRDEDGHWPSGHSYEASDKRHAGNCRAIVRIAGRHPGAVVASR